MVTTAPGWFAHGLQIEPERGRIDVAGAGVSYLAWGHADARPMVLVHGGAAHARWWSAIAPILAEHHRVVALDLTGHGDSDRRDHYQVAQWADEIVAVGTSVGGVGRPVVVGHSMGGQLTILAAARHGSQLAGAIVLDAPIRNRDPESREAQVGRMFRAPKSYPDLETAVDHFHLVPPQPCENDWLVDHVARSSLRESSSGWTWKFDPRIFTDRIDLPSPEAYGAALASAACRVAVVNGAESDLVSQEMRRDMAELLAASPAAAAGVPFIEVPEARHHLILDQPIAVVTAIRAVLAAWHPVGTGPAAVGGD